MRKYISNSKSLFNICSQNTDIITIIDSKKSDTVNNEPKIKTGKTVNKYKTNDDSVKRRSIKQEDILVVEKSKKKVGRPRKVVDTDNSKSNTKDTSTDKQKNTVKETNDKKQDILTKDIIKQYKRDRWTLIGDLIQTINKPYEFCVHTNKGISKICTGYFTNDGLITDSPNITSVLRNKFNNLFVREIVGCQTISNCPNGFPSCKSCTFNKSKQIKSGVKK